METINCTTTSVTFYGEARHGKDYRGRMITKMLADFVPVIKCMDAKDDMKRGDGRWLVVAVF
jgi:hypothetical protein